MRLGPLLLLLAPSPADAQADAQALRLDCAAGGSAYRLELDDPAKEGALACVTRLGAGDPMPVCAPNGGWAVAGVDGSPDRRTTDPRELTAEAPVLFARRGPSEFVASLGMGPGAPLALEIGGRTVWRMRLSLATGEGVVETAEGEVGLQCAP